MLRYRLVTVALVAALGAAACGQATPRATTPQLVVAATGGIAIDPEVVAEFEAAQEVVVVVAREAEPTRVLDDLAANPEVPAIDVVIGLPDAVVLDRGELAFVDISPTGAESLPADLVANAPPRTTPIAIRDLCVLFDRSAITERNLPDPTGFADLTTDTFAGQLVISDPATTLEGRLLLDALRQRLPDDTSPSWLDVAATLQRNGTEIAAGWRAGFDDLFVSPARPDGPALVWAGAGMSAAVLAFVEDPAPVSTLGVVPSTCIRSTSLAAVPEATDQLDLAVAFVAHLLTAEAQVTLVDAAGTLPARRDVALPTAWQRFAVRLSSIMAPTARPVDEPPLEAIWSALTDPDPTDPDPAIDPEPTANPAPPAGTG